MTKEHWESMDALLDAARAGRRTGGGWPDDLLAEEQDAWMLVVSAESILEGVAQSAKAGGPRDRTAVMEALTDLDHQLVRRWRNEEAENWRALGRLLLGA